MKKSIGYVTDFFIHARYTYGTSLYGGAVLEVHTGIVVLLGALVSGAVLLATKWICGVEINIYRFIIGIALSGFYAGVCLQPTFFSWGGLVWRCISVFVVGVMVFGKKLWLVTLYVILSLAIDSLAYRAGEKIPLFGLIVVIIFLVVCIVWGRRIPWRENCIPVELTYSDMHLKVMALRDTGNLLSDPVTGKPVIVVDAKVAEKLTGLSPQQLRFPIETMRNPPLPGLRLISYRSVGQAGGLLLAISIPNIKIGRRCEKVLVAFAPEEFGASVEYSALIGGRV